ILTTLTYLRLEQQLCGCCSLSDFPSVLLLTSAAYTAVPSGAGEKNGMTLTSTSKDRTTTDRQERKPLSLMVTAGAYQPVALDPMAAHMPFRKTSSALCWQRGML